MGAGDARAERRAAAVATTSTIAAAPAPAARLERGARARDAARRTRRRARRAREPAPIASAAPSSASMPACGEPAQQCAARRGATARCAAASTAWLGPSANGGRVVPHQSPSTMSVWRPEAASARPAASAARVRMSSSGAQTAAWPRPPRPQAAATSAAARRQPGRRRRRRGSAQRGSSPRCYAGRARLPPGTDRPASRRRCVEALSALDAPTRLVLRRGPSASPSLRDVDADAVGEGEAVGHRLGRLGLAVDERGSGAPCPCRRRGRRRRR